MKHKEEHHGRIRYFCVCAIERSINSSSGFKVIYFGSQVSDVTHFRADSGSFVLVLEEEGVTWLNVCEKEDDGLQFIVFDELKKHLETRILRDSRGVTDPGEQYMPEIYS